MDRYLVVQVHLKGDFFLMFDKVRYYEFSCICGCDKKHQVMKNDNISYDWETIFEQHKQQIYGSLCSFDNLEDIFQYVIKERIMYNRITKPMGFPYVYRVSLQDWTTISLNLDYDNFTKTVLDNFDSTLLEVKSLKEENKSLKKRNELLENMLSYQPDGDGAKECKNHFIELQSKKSF